MAIAHELKRLRPDVEIVYIGQKGDKLGDLPRDNPDIDVAYSVRAGKFRRYHGEGVKQLFDVKTTLKNVRDVGFVFVGFFQSWLLLRKIRPDSLFIKGGFVGVPVGLAAAIRKIPFITHDSDAMPGLANRIIGRWATVHAVALPKEVYQYAPQKTVTVGVPVHTNYKPVTPDIKAKYRNSIGLGEYDQVLLITGGGLGARRLNTVAAAIVPDLLRDYAKLAVVHTVGRGNEAVMHQTYEQKLSPADLKRVVIDGYLTDLYKYSGASDVIIARAGATNLAEFAVQGKACVAAVRRPAEGLDHLSRLECSMAPISSDSSRRSSSQPSSARTLTRVRTRRSPPLAMLEPEHRHRRVVDHPRLELILRSQGEMHASAASTPRFSWASTECKSHVSKN